MSRSPFLLLLVTVSALAACGTEAVTALSSDVGSAPLDGGRLVDSGVDAGTLDGAGPIDLGAPDLGGADAGPTDTGAVDQGPQGCVYPTTFQEGPADLDELPNPDAAASVVLRAMPEEDHFLVTWLFGAGPRSDEPFPVARTYGRTGPHLAEQNLLSLAPSTRIFDAALAEPGFSVALVEDGRQPAGLAWNDLGSESSIAPDPGRRFGRPVFHGNVVQIPEHPLAPGPSGHPEELRLWTYTRAAGGVTTTTISGGALALGFEAPQLAVGPGNDLWLGVVQDFDFPPTAVAQRLDSTTGQILETIYSRNCGEVLTHYELLDDQGNVAVIVDCGGSSGGTLLTLGRGSFRADVEILGGGQVRAPSQVARNGQHLAVAYWDGADPAPTIRFLSGQGQWLSDGGIRLPVPSGVEGATPSGLELVGISGQAGGFDLAGAAWGVAYSYRSALGGTRTFFARLGPCGTRPPR